MNGSDAYELSVQDSYIEAFTHLGWDAQLEGAAEGIWRQVVFSDRKLSSRQIEVITAIVDKFCEEHKCPVCGGLEINDIGSFFDSGTCGWHKDD